MHGTLPKWISDFAEGFSKNETTADIENTEQEKVAIINLNDLPNVVWQDETFYALIDPDKKIATVYNEFQNVVTIIENVGTIEEVNDFLNSNEVVKAEEEEIELEKISNEDEENSNLLSEADYHLNGEPNDLPSFKESLEDQINKVSSIMELTEKFAILENKISELSNEIIAMKAQEYARTEPEGIYNEDRTKAEIEHFNETAKTTEEKIKKDNSVDITTPRGRVLLPLTQKSIAELYETPSDEVDRMSYNRDENIKKISSTDIELFKTGTCINNCNGKLIKTKCINNILGIYCSKCNAEYAINLNNEEIFKNI